MRQFQKWTSYKYKQRAQPNPTLNSMKAADGNAKTQHVEHKNTLGWLANLEKPQCFIANIVDDSRAPKEGKRVWRGLAERAHDFRCKCKAEQVKLIMPTSQVR